MSNIKAFEDKKIRTQWGAKDEDRYFSVVDVVEILTDSKYYQTARNYWKVLKDRLTKERSELVTNCNQLKLQLDLNKEKKENGKETYKSYWEP